MTTFLASFPSPPQGVWHLGWLPIRAYAVCIIVGIIVALVIGDRRWAARGGERGVIYDIALWAVPFGLIGGRLYHVMTDWKTYFGDDGAGFIAALKIWDGGLGIWGAVALGAVGAWIGCRQRGIPLPAFGDAIAPGIVLAQAIGRLGNYFNQELYGRATTMPWGLAIYDRRDPSGIIDPHSLDGVSTGHVVATVQPTFLYELLWNVLIFVALIYIDRRFQLGHGRLFATYVAGYCIGRFWIELLRSDTATHIAGIRINSFTSTFVFIGAVVYIVLAPKGREDPASLAGKPRERSQKETKKPEPEAKAPKQAVTAEDSDLMEWTKELAAVAAPSGVVAGVAVAAQDDEDSADDGGAEDFTPDVQPDGADEAEEPVDDSAAEVDADEAEDSVGEAEPEVVEPESEGLAEESVGDEEAVEDSEALEPEVEPDEAAEPENKAVEDEEPAEDSRAPVERDEADESADEVLGDDEPAEDSVREAESQGLADEAVGEEEAVQDSAAEAVEPADEVLGDDEPAEDSVGEAEPGVVEPESEGLAEESVGDEEAVEDSETVEPEVEPDEAGEPEDEAVEDEEPAEDSGAPVDSDEADESEEEVLGDDEPVEDSVDEAEPGVVESESEGLAQESVGDEEAVEDSAAEAEEPEAKADEAEELEEPADDASEDEAASAEVSETEQPESEQSETEADKSPTVAAPAADDTTEQLTASTTSRRRWRLPRFRRRTR
ncbi:MAG TPA: prolipoprotein diacylglyceryl transferase [Mycobacterium sp.]